MSGCATACCTGLPIAAGMPSNNKLTGKAIYPIFVPLVGSDGTPNVIPAGTSLTQAYIDGKLNEPNKLDRWYIFGKMVNLAFAETVNDTETLDGINYNTGSETKGRITYVHAGNSSAPFLKSAYKTTFDCLGGMGVFWVTNFGNVIGLKDGSGGLLPIDLEDSTMSAQLMESTDAATQKIGVGIQYAEYVSEGCLDYIDACSITYSALKWFGRAPREVMFAEILNAAQTTITGTFNFINSGYGSKDPVIGLLVADLSFNDGATPATVYNKTTSASVAVTSLVPDAIIQDKYVITLAVAQTVADVIEVSLSKDGYSMAAFEVTLG